MMRSSIRTLTLVLAFVASPALAQDPIPLRVGETHSDSLGGSDVHKYALDLEAGQFVYGEADQLTVDLVVTVYAPDQTVLTKIDGPARGAEVFQFETKATGAYRIEVAPFEQARGRYTLAVKRAEPIATTPEGRVDQLMTPYSGDSVPGGVVAVIEDGEIVFSKAYGMANLTHSIPFTVDTRTNIGSTSKQFTAFAIALLDAQGDLSMDDDVRKHIPELKDFSKTVTLRHLMTHTSGYREFLNTLALTGRRLGDGDYVDRQELIEIVQRQPELQNEPGSEWNYNNTGFGLLTEVVKRVTGEEFPDWMEENVFRPLGMDDTYVRAHQAQIIPNSAQGYSPAEEDAGYKIAGDLGGAMGAGGIYTTVDDLALWIRNFKTAELGGAEVMKEMMTPFVLTTGDTTNYGLGFFVDEYRGLKRVQHGGADVAHRSMLMYFPEIDAGVLTLSNNASFSGSIANDVASSFFNEHLEEKNDDPAAAAAEDFDPASYDPEKFDDFAGRYELEAAPGFILAFTREDEKLYTQATGQPKFEIFPTSDSTFKLTVVEASMTFHREPDGSVKAVTLHQNGNHLARRVEEEEAAGGADLADYAGRYFSSEIETHYTLAVKDSALVIQHRRLDDVTLTRTKGETFSGGYPVAEVVFERNDSGDVTGFSVSNVRTRGVRFERVD